MQLSYLHFSSAFYRKIRKRRYVCGLVREHVSLSPFRCLEVSADKWGSESERWTVEWKEVKEEANQDNQQTRKEMQGQSLATFNDPLSFIFTVIWQPVAGATNLIKASAYE